MCDKGVVTRRHTLGKRLTFVDVRCTGPGAAAAVPWSKQTAAAAAAAAATNDASITAAETASPDTIIATAATATSADSLEPSAHFVFLKCFGRVDKLMRPGATVRFTGEVLHNQKGREGRGGADMPAPGSYYALVPEVAPAR